MDYFEDMEATSRMQTEFVQARYGKKSPVDLQRSGHLAQQECILRQPMLLGKRPNVVPSLLRLNRDQRFLWHWIWHREVAISPQILSYHNL